MRNHPGKLAIACAGSVVFIFGAMMTIPATNIEYVDGMKSILLLSIGSLYFSKKWADRHYHPFFEEGRAPLNAPNNQFRLEL